MLRSICAAVVAGAASLCSIPATAQTAVLYGLIDASGSRVKEVGGDWRWQLDADGMPPSYLGVRASEDLGGGLRAVFRLESYLRVDTGNFGRTEGDAFWAREASVGLSGQFGTTVLGRTPTPLYLSTVNFNPFGESPRFSPSARQYFGSRGAVLGDTRWNNSIWYSNISTGAPLRVTFSANLPEQSPDERLQLRRQRRLHHGSARGSRRLRADQEQLRAVAHRLRAPAGDPGRRDVRLHDPARLRTGRTRRDRRRGSRIR